MRSLILIIELNYAVHSIEDVKENDYVHIPRKICQRYIAYKLLTGDTNPLKVKDHRLMYDFQWKEFDCDIKQALCFPQCREEVRFQIAKIISTN